MRVNNISNNLSFGKVYACAGTKEQINELKDIIQSSKGNGMVYNATDLYINREGDGLCTQAARQGKEIAFVVAGKKDTDKVSFMESGWSSINGISRHLDRFIELTDVKKQVRAIQIMMKK